MGYRTHTADAKHTGVFVADDDKAVLLDDFGNQEAWVLKGDTKEIATVGARVMTDAVDLLRGNTQGGNDIDVVSVDETLLHLRLLGAELRVWEPDTLQNDLGRMYVLDVLGLSIVVRERSDGTYVHVEDEAVVRKPLLVEVNNGGENVYGEHE